MATKKELFKQCLLDAVKMTREVSEETGTTFSGEAVLSVAQTLFNNANKDERVHAMNERNGNGNGNGTSKDNPSLANAVKASVPHATPPSHRGNGNRGKPGNGNGSSTKGIKPGNENEPATEKQIKMLYWLAGEAGYDPKPYLRDEVFGKELEEVTRQEASDAINAFKENASLPV